MSKITDLTFDECFEAATVQLEGLGCSENYQVARVENARYFESLALAQQLSRIADSLESILTLVQQKEERDWKKVRK